MNSGNQYFHLQLTAAILQLEREHEMLLKKKEEYARTARLLALKLERANNIIQGLSSEKERWNNKFLVSNNRYIMSRCLIYHVYVFSIDEMVYLNQGIFLPFSIYLYL